MIVGQFPERKQTGDGWSLIGSTEGKQKWFIGRR